MALHREIIVLGGPNGAGKTSAAHLLFERHALTREFVNADEIARGISPFNPEKAAISAGRVTIARMKELLARNESFVVETTCSGVVNARLFQNAKKDGWRVYLLFLWLPSPQIAVERVARRVAKGGHFIPDDVVVRRYWAGLRNLHQLYLPLADTAAIYDNSDDHPVVIAEKSEANRLVIRDQKRWSKMLEDQK
jgi:predicted ABC-type ATPase